MYKHTNDGMEKVVSTNLGAVYFNDQKFAFTQLNSQSVNLNGSLSFTFFLDYLYFVHPNTGTPYIDILI